MPINFSFKLLQNYSAEETRGDFICLTVWKELWFLFHALFGGVDIVREVLHALILALDDDIEVLCFVLGGRDDAQ